MSTSAFFRWSAVSFASSGAVWAALGLATISGFLQAISGREDVALFIVAHLLLVSGLAGLHALQKGGYGLLGRTAFYVSLAAISARVLGAVVFLSGSAALEWISLPATLGLLAGLVLYGVATVRAGVLPRWCGPVLALAMPVSFPLGAYGTTLFGVILFVIGCGLWLTKRSSPQPSRVS